MAAVRRGLFNALTLVSLVLCGATIAMWAGGCVSPTRFVRQHSEENADGSVTNREAWFTVAHGGLAHAVLGQRLPPYDPRVPAFVPLRFVGRGDWQRVDPPAAYPYYVTAPAGCLDSWRGGAFSSRSR